MNKVIWIQFILITFLILPGFSQNDTPDNPPAAADTLRHDFGLFAGDDRLLLTLCFDIKEYCHKKFPQ